MDKKISTPAIAVHADVGVFGGLFAILPFRVLVQSRLLLEVFASLVVVHVHQVVVVGHWGDMDVGDMDDRGGAWTI